MTAPCIQQILRTLTTSACFASRRPLNHRSSALITKEDDGYVAPLSGAKCHFAGERRRICARQSARSHCTGPQDLGRSGWPACRSPRVLDHGRSFPLTCRSSPAFRASASPKPSSVPASCSFVRRAVTSPSKKDCQPSPEDRCSDAFSIGEGDAKGYSQAVRAHAGRIPRASVTFWKQWSLGN